jgi:hypothetical protein
VLTVATHPGGDAFLEAAVLAPVPVDPEDAALLVLGARTVLDLLLDGAPEEALKIRLIIFFNVHVSDLVLAKKFWSLQKHIYAFFLTFNVGPYLWILLVLQ